RLINLPLIVYWMIVADFRLSLIVTILFALCIEAGIFMLIAHWWGMTAAITVIAIECVLALWTVYEMRHASDEPVDE
ncbi:hypothetical protein, partial [Leyella stercorea]